jgi:hypothetical protein
MVLPVLLVASLGTLIAGGTTFAGDPDATPEQASAGVSDVSAAAPEGASVGMSDPGEGTLAELETVDGVTRLRFDDFYSGYSKRGPEFSDTLQALDGQRVRMEGYMAPPLKPELDFFVLTPMRLAYCPFCSSAGEWPDDIALVYLVADPVRTTERPVTIEGRLELGEKQDPETGMVSLVRIYADHFDKL